MSDQIKTWLQKYAISYLYTRKRRIERLWSILQTPYWYLACQERLNHRCSYKRPEINVLIQDDDMDLLDIEGLQFLWPHEYEQTVLAGSYREIFAPAAINPHAYEESNVRVRPGDWVVDAGACEGFFTFFALQRGANVLMIEPVPRLAAALERTFAREIEEGRVKLIQAGLGAKPGEGKLSIDPTSVVISKIDAEGQENVPILSLDQILADGVVPRIDFLKMDIEGFETAAIKGAIKILEEQKPLLSIAVYHEFNNARILRDFILYHQPKYRIRFRGIFIKQGYGKPRPFMLLGHY